MNKKMPRISFLIPAFNHQDFVKQCINSILVQDYSNFEIIVVDDCSTDNTADQIKEINDNRITFIQNTFNHGMNGNLNVAFENSNGDFIAIIASDDYIDNNYINSFISFINNKKEDYSVYYPKIIHVDDSCNLDEPHPQFPKIKTSPEILKNLFLYGNCLGSPGMIIPRDSALKIFPLDTGIHQHQDFIMHIQLLFIGEPAFMPDVKVYYRIPTDNNSHMSSNRFKAYKRIEIETPHALNYFLNGIKTTNQLIDIFGKIATKYGNPTNETIPYFLARIAIDSKDNRLLPVWGFRTLIEYLSRDNHQELLYKLYGFQYKDFSALFNNVRLLDDFLADQKRTYENSFSWKITSPVRKIAAMLKKGNAE